MMRIVPLGEIVQPAQVERAGDLKLTVLSMTRSSGLVPQESVFNKVVASRDISKYKIVRPNQLVVGIHIDEGALGFSGPNQTGIVSPAYTLWDLRDAATIHSAYMDRFIRSPQAVAYFISKYRETAERRGKLTREQFLALNVPLPPLAEQKRIAAILDAADALRAKRRETLAQLDTLLQSTFLDMFGDPETREWPMATVEEVALPKKGSIRTGPFGSQLLHSEFVDEGIRVLGIDNAVANEFREGEARYITHEKYKHLRRYTVRPGDVLITIMGTCGRCAIVPAGIEKSINTKHLCCITLDPEKCMPGFMHAYFLRHRLARTYLERNSKGAIMSGLNMEIIKKMPILLPPLPLQRRFATIVESVEQQKTRLRAHLAELDTLFASLQDRAFKGAL